MLTVARKCPFTGSINYMNLDVTNEQLERYACGNELVQDVFPHLSADEREFIKTGITPEMWDAIFNSADDLSPIVVEEE